MDLLHLYFKVSGTSLSNPVHIKKILVKKYLIFACYLENATDT